MVVGEVILMGKKKMSKDQRYYILTQRLGNLTVLAITFSHKLCEDELCGALRASAPKFN